MLIGMLLEDMLGDMGHDVVAVVPRVNEALAAVQHEAFDVAILDVHLNGQSAFPVAEALIERGIPFAIAHIRGGDEMGEAWHDDGMLMKKRNTFFDFVDCAAYLVGEKWTSPDRLLIEGGSAGGLLMGAVVNERPELFRAVHAAVPFVDVINTMMDASLPLTVGEYLEWGNPNQKPAFDYMLSYSPYDNLAKRAYPAMLVTTSSSSGTSMRSMRPFSSQISSPKLVSSTTVLPPCLS